MGLLGIGGLLLFWGTACKPKTEVTCYIIYDPFGHSKKTEIQIPDLDQAPEAVKQESQQDNGDQKESNEGQKEE